MIKQLYLKKRTAAQIKSELDEVHRDTAPTLKTVYFWINEFKCGQMTTKDEARLGRPLQATAPEMIEKIYCILKEDHRIKVREIANDRRDLSKCSA